MRRAVLALAVTGVFLTGACGTAVSPPSATPGGQATAGDVSVPPGLAQTRALCDGLSDVYGKNIGPFAQALSEMVAHRQARAGGDPGQQQAQHAQQALRAFATAVRTATEASADATVRADGKQAADRMQAKSGDKKFFNGIRTTQDVQTVLGPTLKEWLAPVTQHCS